LQIVSQYSSTLAPIAVKAVTSLVTQTSSNVDLRDVRIVKKVGGTIEDTELVEGVVLNQNIVTSAGGPSRMEKAKIGIIQFQLSAPKPDVRLDAVATVLLIRGLTYIPDGQHRHHQRLPSNGQGLEGGSSVPAEHLQED
jgi:chaperonin GroEL (HSP60 family)